MKNLFLVLIIFFSLNPVFGQDEKPEYKTVADNFEKYYNQNNPDEIFNMFAKVMKDAMPIYKTKELVTGLKAQAGSIVSKKFSRYEFTAAQYITRFDNMTLIMQISIDSENKIDGLYFKPYEAEETSKNVNEESDIFTESDITLKTATGDINGTLMIPKGVKSSTLVLFIAGSGPTDRNCNQHGIKTNAFKMLAEALAKEGISSVRYDKRGVAASTNTAMSESELNIGIYIDDAIGWINKLKSDTRFSKVYILGHSEGSLIGIMAAKQTHAQGFISVAGCGRPASTVILEQIKESSPDYYQETKVILDSLVSGYKVKKVSSQMQSLFRPSVQPYMISWLKLDPSKEIKSLRIPVLIIQGTTDLQIKVEDAKLLASAKPGAELLIIDKMNHVLKESEADRSENIATYTNPDLPLKDGLVKGIVKFINK